MSRSPHRRGRVPHSGLRKLLTAESFRLRLSIAIMALLAFSAIVAASFAQLTTAQANRVDPEAAFAAKADKVLKRVRRAAIEDRVLASQGRLKRETSEVDRLSQTVGVERQSGNRVTVDVAVRLTVSSDEALKAAGFHTAARVGDMATLQAEVDRLPELAALESVSKIFAAINRYPLNDRARQNVGIEDVSEQRTVSQTGRGVVVAIIDSGIDFRHLDFTVPGSGGRQTRIKALLDMTVYGSQDPGWNYALPGQSAAIGHLYTEVDINSALQSGKPADQNADIVKQRDKNGHGTHVAGTAAGNGLSSPTVGTYAGMAPEADLIVIKASRQNNEDASFRTTDIINALQFVQQKAVELNEPFVVNLSLGAQLGPHDGTNPDERAIDNLVNSGPGRAVCVAAGNSGNSTIHSRAIVPAGGSLTLDFNVNGRAEFVDLYQANSDRLSVTVTRPDGVALGPVSYDPNGLASPNGQASDEYLQVFNANDDKGDTDPSNDQPDIFLVFKNGAPNGMWKITVQDADGNPNLPFNAWAGGEGVYFSNYIDNDSSLVASPGTARGAITVGAFVTRSASLAIGSSASFTSPGPTADGRQKPEISAAGYYLYSARSTDVSDANSGTIGAGSNAPTDSTHYTGMAGTSMATPVTAGAVALLLEASPTLSGAQIKDRLTNYSVRDIFTGTGIWNKRFGFGKLNIANAINQSGGGVGRYSVSGRMTNQDGSGVGDLQMFLELQGSSHSMGRTDANGNYGFTNLLGGGNYRVVPSPQGGLITYAPATYTFNNLSADQTANFVRTVATTVTVSGRITDNSGFGIPNIQVEVPGAMTPNGLPILPTRTDGNGNYTYDLVPGRSYTVTPTTSSYTYTPGSRSFLGLTENQIANFTAQPVGEPRWQATAITSNQIEIRTWQYQGRTYAYVKLTFPDAGFRVANWGWPVQSGNDFSADVLVERFTGTSVPAVKTTAQIYDLGPLAPGNYNFIFRTWAAVVKTLAFTVSASPPPPNPIDDQRQFVRQHYLDFLNREPDGPGWDHWTGEITQCTTDPSKRLPGESEAQCIIRKRANTSAAFFLSPEFQNTGYFALRVYRGSLGRMPYFGGSVPADNIKDEFTRDHAAVSTGIVVNNQLDQARMYSNKQAFVNQFVTRSDFLGIYGGLNDEQYVDKLFETTNVAPTATERQALINGLAAGSETRASVLFKVVDGRIEDGSLVLQTRYGKLFYDQQFNPGFVQMEYFGYMKRDPDDGGYAFWLGKLNHYGGNWVNAEMVLAFISSPEYRARFGQP